MYEVIATNQFRKDYKLCIKRKKEEEIRTITLIGTGTHSDLF
jgi:mRNA-degrading endonuclease YafQ of YafQ-DinJ toxin-antitoxin module